MDMTLQQIPRYSWDETYPLLVDGFVVVLVCHSVSGPCRQISDTWQLLYSACRAKEEQSEGKRATLST